MRSSTPLPISLLLLLLSSTPLASAQFGSFFDQMFGSSSSSNQRERGNVASDSSWYQQTYDGATCSNYLCPGTLACVDKPTHCPCPWPGVEEKFELDVDGIAVCLSRGGRAGFVERKVELARKGLL